MTSHEQLPGMPDNTMFIGFFEESLIRAKKVKRNLGLLLLDLDGYGTINDRFGHEAADVLLSTIAERLRYSVRETDMAAHFGEDAFAVALVDPKNIAAIAMTAERIRKNLNAPLLIKEGVECSIGVSIGIAVYPENGTELDRLLTVADSAMFESKTSGKNTSTIYKGLTHERADIMPWIALGDYHRVGIPEIDDQHNQLANLINELHEAIRDTEKNNQQHVSAMYDELIAFTELHFNTEVRLMSEAGYPQADAHKRAHNFLLSELRYLKMRIIEGNELQAFKLLSDWFIAHIEKDDKPLGDFLRTHAPIQIGA
jgi:diguanylate cyclase (GGDEF)-like protein/hemerythrin-like metal-binding protein